MTLETLPKKQLQELEELSTKLVTALKKAKLHDTALCKEVQALKEETEKIRRARFDAENGEYSSY
jgi:hypothetical protein